MIDQMKTRVVYREVQRPRQVWIWLLVAGLAILMWSGFVQQVILGKPFGDKPAPDGVLIVIWFLFGIIFPVVMLGFVKLVTEVREAGEDSGVYVRFFPFHMKYRSFLLRDMIRYEVIAYNPVQRFGGLGIRVNLKGEKAYNVRGNRGVELAVNGQTVVIGTQRPDAFKEALDKLKAKHEHN